MFKICKKKINDIEVKSYESCIEFKKDLDDVKSEIKELEDRVKIAENPINLQLLHARVYGLKSNQWIGLDVVGDGYVVSVTRGESDFKAYYNVYIIGEGLYRVREGEILTKKPKEDVLQKED